jgi:hypothetical protein
MGVNETNPVPTKWSRGPYWLAVISEAMVASISFWLASFVLISSVHTWQVVQAAIIFLVGILLVSRVYLRVKHRHVLDTDYVIGRDGVTIEDQQGSRYLSWDQFVKAQFLPLSPLYRLFANNLPKPVVIFAMGGWGATSESSQKRTIATDFLTEGLKNRLTTRWLPW